MEFIAGLDRAQYTCYMGCLDDIVSDNNPVRFIDAYVDKLDMVDLCFQSCEPQDTGRPAYDPRDLLKLYIYGYCNRVRSTRNLERECHKNIEVIWLMKNLKPDHKTISRFRQNNPKGLKNVFRNFVRLCMGLNLYGKELIAVDGSKFKAWNSKDRNFTKGKIEDRIRRIEEKIDSYLSELERLDQIDEVDHLQTPRDRQQIEEILLKLNERKTALEGYRDEVTCGEETQVSLTDPDSRLMKTKDGMEVCLNVQTAVDSKNKMIAEFLVGNQVQDKNMMSPMACKASEILEAENMVIVADNGYDSVSDVAQVLESNNTPVVAGGDYEFWYPTSEENAEEVKDYDEAIARSVYLPERNVLICPMGQFLYPSCYVKSKHIAKYGNPKACAHCPKKCTSMKYNYAERMIKQSEFSKEYDASSVPLRKVRILQNKEIASQRKSIVEHPFGTVKRDLGIAYLLLRTIPKAEGELSLAFLAFNIKRALNIVGIEKMMEVL